MFYESIESLVKKNAFKKCKIITGFNKNEMGLFSISYGLLGRNPAGWQYAAQTMNFSLFSQDVAMFFNYYPAYPNVSNQNITNAIINAYLPKNLTDIATYYPYLDRIATDFVFSCQSFELSEIYSKQMNDVYFYEYDYKISSTIYPDAVGIIHADELPIVFDEELSNKVKFYF